eukprot:gnl/MRDRNA2_/MRDRNA2_34794_c0_seq1.p1 gnl/MRDRNA2_/MRDRNA2_34794_c0~~gnl/MRDRNA2_/MRDRNA2_34794_c0_seq1.p1  ORF type:complete len:402 (+),score=63.68 gnl/MRDRNA2_/MRDRNA2_34794_c0_seq1:129-1208(+)
MPVTIGIAKNDLNNLILKHRVRFPSDKFGSALNYALLDGHVELAQALIEQRADVVSPYDVKYSAPDRPSFDDDFDRDADEEVMQAYPFSQAVQSGHVGMMEFLLKRMRTEQIENACLDSELLETALFYGHIGATKLLLQSRANPNSAMHRPGQEVTFPLLAAAGSSANPSVVELLLEYRAKISLRDRQGRTALHSACGEIGSVEGTQLLVRLRASISAKDRRHQQPLHHAALSGHVVIVELLTENGASLSARDKLKHQPLHLAVREGHRSVVELMVRKRADISRQDVIELAEHPDMRDFMASLREGHGSETKKKDADLTTWRKKAKGQGKMKNKKKRKLRANTKKKRWRRRTSRLGDEF